MKKYLSLDRALIFSIIFLSISALVLTFANSSFVVFSAEDDCTKCTSQKNEATEIIYENVKCSDCHCEDSGKPLIIAHGTWADCEKLDMETAKRECESNKRIGESCENINLEVAKGSCYRSHSQLAYVCSYLKDSNQRLACEKRNSMFRKSYYGGAGTFATQYNITVGGKRIYFVGFDAEGKHKIMTSFADLANPITFRDTSRDVEAGGDFYIGLVGEKNIAFSSNKSSISFSNDIDYNRVNLKNGVSGLVMDNQFETGVKRAGVYNDEYRDLIISANSNNILFFSDKSDKRKESYESSSFSPLKVKKGLDVEGNIAVEGLKLDGVFETYMSAPIRNSRVLYYDEHSSETLTAEEIF